MTVDEAEAVLSRLPRDEYASPFVGANA